MAFVVVSREGKKGTTRSDHDTESRLRNRSIDGGVDCIASHRTQSSTVAAPPCFVATPVSFFPSPTQRKPRLIRTRAFRLCGASGGTRPPRFRKRCLATRPIHPPKKKNTPTARPGETKLSGRQPRSRFSRSRIERDVAIPTRQKKQWSFHDTDDSKHKNKRRNSQWLLNPASGSHGAEGDVATPAR